MRRRILLLLAAFVVALAGTSAVFVHVSRINAQAAAEQDLVEVLAATQLIPAGTSTGDVEQKQLSALIEVPRQAVPDGALHEMASLAGDVAAADIHPGEILLRPKFVSPVQAGALQIPDDNVALTVSVTDSQRGAGFVKPGSFVTVFHTYETDGPDNGPIPKAADGPYEVAPGKVEEATHLLVERAKVIAVGPTALHQVGGQAADEEENSTVGGTQEDPKALVTLSVPIEDAQKLAHAAQTGELYLGLLNDKSRTGGLASPVDNRTLTR
jgi:pilus assembly protein CpaB